MHVKYLSLLNHLLNEFSVASDYDHKMSSLATKHTSQVHKLHSERVPICPFFIAKGKQKRICSTESSSIGVQDYGSFLFASNKLIPPLF